MTTDATPYRSGDQQPRFVCVVCYQTVSAAPSVCPRCNGAPLQPIGGPDLTIVTALRNRAHTRKRKPGRQRDALVFGATTVAAVATFILLLATGLYDFAPRHQSMTGVGDFWPLMLLWLGFFLIFFYLVHALGWFKQSPAFEAFDPDAADIPALVEFLGLRIEEERDPKIRRTDV